MFLHFVFCNVTEESPNFPCVGRASEQPCRRREAATPDTHNNSRRQRGAAERRAIRVRAEILFVGEGRFPVANKDARARMAGEET